MNHKLSMHKLEEIKRDLLEKARDIQKKISQVDTAMKEQKRLYMLNNKYSYQCKEILGDRSRQNVREILSFLLDAMIQYDNASTYSHAYRGIDTEKLMNDDNFFDFLITSMGKSVITQLTKKFGGVQKVKGEEVISIKKRDNIRSDHNFRERIYRKFTKKTVIAEAKRIAA